MRRRLFLLVAMSVAARVAVAATFGTVVPITGGATDLVLDEARARLYIVNSTQNRIEVYSTAQRRLLNPIPTGPQPLAAALSRSGQFLYCTVYGASALAVIDLDAGAVVSQVSLPAAPEGVAVGADERVLITTTGSLLRYDPNAAGGGAITPVTSTLPAPGTPGTPTVGQVFNVSRSHLAATPDGRLIVGLNNATNTSRTVFVYETESGSILRSRTVSNISSVLAVSPDGSRFMAGLSMFDTNTLSIMAQQNAANALYPFAQNVNFNTQQNQGGSVFAADGSVLYGAFNIAPVGATRANSSQLMLSDPDNLLIQMALQLPENLTGKMAAAGSGAEIYALSQSGILVLPVGNIYDNPIAVVDNTAVLLATDQCGATADQRKAQVTVRNAGRGRMTVNAQLNQDGVTFTFPLGGQAGGAGAGGPGQQIPIVVPGGGLPVVIPPGAFPGNTTTTTTTQQNATAQVAPQVTARPSGSDTVLEFTINAAAARSLGTGTPADFLVQSPEAINIPSRVRVYQNSRNAEAQGSVVPAPISVSTAEGLADIVSDTARQKLYIANSGLNRVEVFDTAANQFLTPIKAGQLPRSLALSPDGSLLYVANTGGENIGIIDLELGQVTGTVRFPPLPYNASVALNTPSVIAAGLAGLQIVMSDGSLWRVVDNEAMPRRASTVIGTATLQAPRTMIATPGGEYIMLLAGNGNAYLYDAMSDEYVLGQTVAATPIQGYYGPIAAGVRGQYFVVNGTVLNQSLTPVSQAADSRPVSAVAAVNATSFARFIQPVRASTTATVADNPSVEVVDLASGRARNAAAALEGPLSTLVGTRRVNVSARTMAVDANGTTAYLLTTSGLSIVPLAPQAPQARPQVNSGGVVNEASYLANLAAGSIVSIFGQNLASADSAAAPLPNILGGACVTIDNSAVPVLMTSPGQINVQLPPGLTAAKHSLVVRSVDKKAATAAQSITVAKFAPAVYLDGQTGRAAVYHQDGRPVTKSAPAKRDESLYLMATGLGATTGGKVTAGSASPSDPLAVTAKVQVYFGDPRYKQAEMIVAWSGLVPGLVGVYQINITVPGDHMQGDDLPVAVRIGGVNSPNTGSPRPPPW